MSKGLDRNFLEYGIRRQDLEIIAMLCEKHGLDVDWVKENVLKKFHEEKVSKIEMDDASVEKIITKALQNIPQ